MIMISEDTKRQAPITPKPIEERETCKPYFKNAYGYVIFETIGKIGLALIGGAGGEGAVYKRKSVASTTTGVESFEQVGTSKMSQVSIGPQFGGEVYSMIIFFESEGAYKHFIKDEFEFGIDVQVVVLTAEAGATVSSIDGKVDAQAGTGLPDIGKLENTSSTTLYTKGFAVFTTAVSGFFTEASFRGQKFKYKPISSEK